MADYRLNPLTLAYDGAIAENLPGKVNLHPVSYELNGLKIAANVYTPAQYDPKKRYPAVVVAHPNGGVKEQVAGLYAQRLAELGYVTVAADAAYQGASGGVPHNVDKPAHRIEDIHGMADFISRYAGVDTGHLGLLGICSGGGYAVKAAQTDKRFKAVATISMFDAGLARRNGFLDSQLGTVQQRLDKASEARAKMAETGEVEYIGANIPAEPTQLSEEELAKIPFDMYRQGTEYYGHTHFHSNATSANYTTESLMDLMQFDAASNMDLINQPLLMIAGADADSLYMTERAYSGATTTDKELLKIPGAKHIELYWKPEYVHQITEKLKTFYSTRLA